MSTLSSLTQALAREREALLSTIAWLTDAALDQKGVVGEWSIKNVLAHLANRERVVARTLREHRATGARPEALRALSGGEDALDLAEVSGRERLSPTEQVLDLEQARADLLAVLASLDEATLSRVWAWPECEGTLAEHVLAAVWSHERKHRGVLGRVAGRLALSGEYEPGARLSRRPVFV